VAAAVILPDAPDLDEVLTGVRDSKQLSAAARESLSELILRVSVAASVGWASHHQVDRAGIAAANRRAMLRAVRRLPVAPDALLLDHFRLPESDLHQVCITKGDSLCLSIASASIVAKVMRDRWMTAFERRFPGYGFATNKGYGTEEHLQALERLGPSPIHRRSYAPVAVWCL
jgi:ribonuclease HII